MRICILGICGTFMGGLAVLARELGHEVSGADANVYPPMSTQLAAAGIRLCEGYRAADLEPRPDLVLIGNALSRGNPCVEHILAARIPYTSGAQWLAEQVLAGREVIAVAGTHGKSTTTSILAWLLDATGAEPGFLVGAVPQNFGTTARLGRGRVFVLEADEYDTAFFDKRSKFVHYRPHILVINNIEFDHADIFPDLEAIRRQFHHVIRTVPGNGLLLVRAGDAEIERVLQMGCWSPLQTFGIDAGDWRLREAAADYSRFMVCRDGTPVGEVQWTLFGRHNAENALAAVAAACAAGVDPARACAALRDFSGVRRRLERLATINGVSIYDDFAHHPTAIAATLGALRRHVGTARIVAILEPRSNTMKLGVHAAVLGPALAGADTAFVYQPERLAWDMAATLAVTAPRARVYGNIADIVAAVTTSCSAGDHIVVMSNGGFGDIHQQLLAALAAA